MALEPLMYALKPTTLLPLLLGGSASLLWGCASDWQPSVPVPDAPTFPVDHTVSSNDPDAVDPVDLDHDGYPSAEDCNEYDADVHPGVAEVCDGVDNDCSGVIDDDPQDGIPLFPDADGDGQGAVGPATRMCTAVYGWRIETGDCDDADPTSYAGADEVCDERDNDCDGAVDNGAIDMTGWYIDADGDGFGDDDEGLVASCGFVPGLATVRGDCDDADPAVSPVADELCDGADNDCDGVADDNPTSGDLYYPDRDGDGFGMTAGARPQCGPSDGWASVGEDCDDFSVDVAPGAAEVCDGVDNDCDGIVDPTATGETRNGADDDCDGFVDEDFVHVGDLVISEVARQPYVGGSGSSANPAAQWFEVRNGGPVDLHLDNWRVTQHTGHQFTVAPSAHVVVPAGGYAVFCFSAEAFEDAGFGAGITCDYTWGDNPYGGFFADHDFILARDLDELTVSIDGAVLDTVSWTGASGYEWPRESRYSMELSGASLDPAENDWDTAWCLASDSSVYGVSESTGAEYGTPGAANGACP